MRSVLTTVSAVLLLQAQRLDAQARLITARGWLDADLFAALAPPDVASSWRFAGGARFLAHPASAGGIGVVVAGAELSGRGWRSRVATQVGDGVDARASRDHGRLRPHRFLRELSIQATARCVSLGAGVFPNPALLEEWIPGTNSTYTRSMLYDFAPLQLAGAWVGVFPWSWFDVRAHAINGWESVGGSLTPRGFGGRVDLRPAASVLLRGHYLSTTQTAAPRRRLAGLAAQRSGRMSIRAAIDLGSQENSSPFNRAAHWWGYELLAHWRAAPRVAASARFERFDDDKQIVLRTGALASVPNAPFRGYGESVGLDVFALRRLTLRSEVRAFQNSGPSFAGRHGTTRRSAAFFAVALVAGF